ncbi:hypothetical protein SKAU_G00193690 [Synaphobranchus kaupii]|uniref:ribonuclease H n=1 Tax=Synaphobranchus kaupii TaxID=118154 RepID=A0A9Q1IXN2_SYNKA|nr:hypothetical protein SKAU_G00193690 [Synaphobranchus kaupii]
MSHAYAQILKDDESKKYLTVNTHKGMFTYNRLPFGVSSAPAVFQRTMEGDLQGIPMVAVYLDDILVSGASKEEHLRNLNEVLGRLEEAGLRLKRSKCQMLQSEVFYLGHKVDAQGLHPMEAKVKAIREAPPPSNVTELKAYLGKDHSNADALSRLPVPELVEDDSLQGQVLMIDHMDDAPVNMSQVRKWTAKDATLSLVHSYVLNGWPEVRDPRLMPYYTRRLELSARDGCVLWGARTVIPPQGRSILLKMLHQSHPLKDAPSGLARSYLWWPRMDEDIAKKKATTGLSPAEMLMSRPLRSAYDLLKIQQKQLIQKEQHDKTAKLRQFMPGEAMYARNYGLGPKGIPATVESPSGPVSYTVLLGNGQRMRRHVDQVRARHPEARQSSDRLVHPPEELDNRPVERR